MRYIFKFQGKILAEEELPNDLDIIDGRSEKILSSSQNKAELVFDLSDLPTHIIYSKRCKNIAICRISHDSLLAGDCQVLWQSDEDLLNTLFLRLK